ncbi:hypothetical protein FRC01_006827, partial [Tulasnella sp. 417]
VVRRSTTQWDEDGLPTLVDAPPLTPSKLAAPTAEPEEELSTDASRHKRPSRPTILFIALRDKLWAPLTDPHVTVHSFFIEYIEDGTKWKPKRIVTKVKVDLNDPQAVRAAAKVPLLTINSIGADRLV